MTWALGSVGYASAYASASFVPYDVPEHAPVYSSIGHDLAGLLFENMALRDVRVYLDAIGTVIPVYSGV